MNINSLSTPLSAGAANAFAHLVFLGCLRGAHDGLHLASVLHTPPFILQSIPCPFFPLLAQDLSFHSLFGLSRYSLISFHSSVFTSTFLFFSLRIYCWMAFITSGFRIIYPLCLLSSSLKFIQCYFYFPPDSALLRSDFPLLFLSAVRYL